LKLNILFHASSLEGLQAEVERHFNQRVRLIREENSIFNQWQVRPGGGVFIPKVWTYRIVFDGGLYYFGTI
jgi:hypothetical protein